jgi:hypothetical protein
LEFKVVGAYRDVSGIRCLDLDPGLALGLEDAEKIALITGNRDIQVAFTFPWDGKAFLLHHEASGLAAECRIVRLDFEADVNARDILARPNPWRGPWGL